VVRRLPYLFLGLPSFENFYTKISIFKSP